MPRSKSCFSRKRIDLRGKMFGRWEVVGDPVKGTANALWWLCRCVCGVERRVKGQSLRDGVSVSCGCYQREGAAKQAIRIGKANRTHGMTNSSEWNAWARMKQRCYDPKTPGFERYGGRGVKMCERWQNFENFFADMGEKPTPEHSIDRIDNDGDYEPSNCRWATCQQQQRNRRDNIVVTHDGKTQCVSAWAEEYGICHHVLGMRLRRGWDMIRALSQPVKRGRPKKNTG